MLLVLGLLPAQYASAQTVNICSRTDAVEAALLRETGAADCTAVPEADLNGITSLNLFSSGISTLQSDDFADLSSLEFLDLGFNSLTALPADVFDGLSSLVTLDLGFNSLTTLPPDVFDGLLSLETLDLNGNSLTTFTLPADVFDGLSNLVTLHLNVIGLTTLPEDVFDGLSSLETLDLGSTLTTLPEDVFDGLSNLVELGLFGNDLTTLPADVFDGLSSLETLDLRDNSLTTLPADVFDGLSNLETLLLDGNSLTTLPADVFDGLSNLETLRLADNSLTTLPADVFDGLSNLVTLLLDGNPFQAAVGLPAGVFDDIVDTLGPIISSGIEGFRVDQNVRDAHFVCSRPDADAITASAGATDCLLVTAAQFNAAAVPTATISAPTSAIAETDLNGLELEVTLTNTEYEASLTAPQFTINHGAGTSGVTVSGVARTSATVATLTLAYTTGINASTTLGVTVAAVAHTGSENLTTDNTIDVTATDGTVNICARTAEVIAAILDATAAADCTAVTTVTGLHRITRLDLANSGISTLQSGDFADLPSLETLDLGFDILDFGGGSRNSLTTLPADVFDGLSSLTTLLLSSNDLTTLPEDVFDGLSNLENLSLAGNSLTTLPEDVFDGLSSLEDLGLDLNSLTTLPASVFDGLSSLESLSLIGNRLTTLPADVFDGLSSLRVLFLNSTSLTALPADVFDGLSNLVLLGLSFNSLTTLPADVFDGLSSLETLDLRDNSLTTLPADVFDGLSSLEILALNNNDLTTLPADVFDGLSSLETLRLNDNAFQAAVGLPAGVFDDIVDTLGNIRSAGLEGFIADQNVRDAHFVCSRPDADAITASAGATDCLLVTAAQFNAALAPRATISAPTTAIAEADLNGMELTVTLTNTEYEASLTAPQFTINHGAGASGVTVSGVVRTGATVATLTLAYTTGINADTSLGVTVAAAAHTGSGDLTTSNTIPVTATAVTPSLADATFTVAENTAANSNVGTPLVAADFPPGAQTWAIVSGNTGNDFAINPSTGQLSVAVDDALNFEDTASYTLMVSLTIGTAMAQATVTLTVTDVDEPPAAPAAPTVTPAVESLNVSWAAPDNTGPAITRYDVRYREGSTGAYTDANPGPGTALSLMITGLTADVVHEVQVRAVNDEGDGQYSTAVSGTPSAATVPTAAISETSPSTLTEANLDGATLTVTLTNATYEAEASLETDQFTLTTDISGLTVASFNRDSETVVTLTLTHDDTDLTMDESIGVTLAMAAHTGTAPLTTTNTVAVTDNAAPVITDPGSQSYVQGTLITPLQITVDDDDGDAAGAPPIITVIGLPSGLLFDPAQNQITGTPDAPVAAMAVTITADDGVNDMVTLEFVITVVAPATPIISGALVGTLVEDAPTTTASGTLAISNPGSGATTFTPQTTPGTYGGFSITANGGWSYALNNSATATDELAAGVLVTDTFEVRAVNAAIAAATVTISITGANDAPTATAGGLPMTVVSGGTVALTGTGTDPDTGAVLTFQWSAAGDAGTFTNATMANASWDAPRVDSATTIVITLTVSDGAASASATVDVMVLGNQPSVIGGDLTGVASVAVPTATGTLTSTDPDGPDDMFTAATGIAGAYGSLDINADGAWRYTLDITDADTIALAAGQTMDDVLDITTADGTTGMVTLTVTGANDAPLADAGADQQQGQGTTVTLDGSASSDPDSGASLSYAWTQTSGTPTVILSGQATATATFTAPTLAPGVDSLQLEFTLTVTDGTATATDTAVITITDEPSVIGGNLAGRVSENAPTATGTLTSNDPDGTDNMFMAASLTGTYGTLDIEANGAWRYTLDLADDDTVALLATGRAGEDEFMVSAADGTPATITITIGEREEARREALEMTLSTFGRPFAAGTVNVLGERFSGGGTSGNQLTLGGRTLSLKSLTSGEAAASVLSAAAGGHRTSARELLSGSAFRLSLDSGDAAGMGATTLWARGAVGNYEGEPEDGFDLDVDIVSGYLGLDYRLGRRTLVGVSVSHSRGDVDFSSADIADGEVQTKMTSILPYVQWQARANLSLWGIVGYGEGEAEITDNGERTKADTEMQMAAAGAHGKLWSEGRMDVALKASGFTVEIKSDSEANLSSVTTDAQRLRVALQGSRHGEASEHGARLSQRLEMGLRWDGGDAETGAGADLGAGLEYANPRSGSNWRLDGHYLLVHEESDFEEWELSAAVSINPSMWGRGVKLTLEPGWGSSGDRQRMALDFTDALGPAWRERGSKLELYGERTEDYEFGLRGSLRF